MRFKLPNGDGDFEIPDEWLAAAEVTGFKAERQAYLPSPGSPSELVELSHILPPVRLAGVPQFEPSRMISILVAIRTSSPLPPIIAHGPAPGHTAKYSVREGMHRYYASVAMGFSSIPAILYPYWDIGDLCA